MKRITVPFALGLLVLLVFLAVRVSEPQLIGPGTFKYALVTILVCFTIALVRTISFVLFDVIFRRRKAREAPALLRLLLSIILYSVFFLIIYRVILQVQLGDYFVLPTTVVSVIIGLALQDTLGNFFAGLSIHVEQPFHIFDAIRIGDITGRVEAVTWRTTTIRTNNNTTVIFPNSRVAREALEVYKFNNLNRRILRVPAPFSIAPQKVISLLRETAISIPNVASERTPIVRIGDFGDSNVIYEILYWVKDYMLIHDIDALIRQHLWYIYRRNDVEIPFPVRHVLLEEQQARVAHETADYDKLIESVEIFEPLSAREKEAVASSAIKAVYAPGELILRSGDAGDSMFIVCRGKVEVRLRGTDGNAQQVAELGPGNFFGEMALLTGEPRNADVIASDEVGTLEIKKDVLKELLENNADLAEALSHKITERQTRLDEYARSMPEEEKTVHRHAILRRIQRFFGLN
jgi:small-conductance mechanosensitive channel/CRP-like cAMP-binding protein